MKIRITKITTFIVTIIMCLSIQMVWVSAKEQSGLDVKISTDKRNYKKGDNVQVTVDMQNKNDFTVTDVKVDNKLQDGLAFETSTDSIKNIGEIRSGQKNTFTFNAKICESNNPSGGNEPGQNTDINSGSTTVKPDNSGGDNDGQTTMDANDIIFCIAVLFIALTIMTLSFKDKKSQLRKISIILCLLTSSQLISSHNYAKAADTDILNNNEVKLSLEKDISIDESTLKYEANVTFKCIREEDNQQEIVMSKKETSWNEDSDSDRISNDDEEKYGTDPYNEDTDNDGLSDYDERYTYKTDALKEDTDGDGVLDGEEVSLGTDPLKKKSDDVNLDGERTYEKVIDSDDFAASVKVTGSPSIVSTTIDNRDISALKSFSGIYGDVKEFHCNGKFNNAVITFNYSDKELEAKKMKAEDLSIFYFNESTKTFEKIPSTIDVANKKVSATVEHFSSYALADSTKLASFKGTQMRLVIDNSGSMYPKSLCTDSYESDVDFKRVDFANKLIDKFSNLKDQTYEFGVSKFTRDYTELCQMTNDYAKLKESINSIKTTNETFNGTYLGCSMKSALNSFDKSDYSHKKYIVILTDGKTTEDYDPTGSIQFFPTPFEIRDQALEQGVVVFAVGLGNNVDKDYLMKISNETGGEYFIAPDANSLDDIYNKIIQTINYNEIDTDGDYINDAIVMADSQFDVKKDGFRFPNGRIYGSEENGFCYGMAEFAERYYTKTLPLTLKGDIPSDKYCLLGEPKWKVSGYDFNNDPFFGKMKDTDAKNLYDYIPGVYNLQYQGGLRDTKEPYDFLQNPRTMLENTGYVIRRDEDRENLYIDINSDKYLKNAENTEVQLFRALSRLYITQKFEENNDDVLNIKRNPEKTVDTIKQLLQDKVPTLICIGGHAVNVIRMVRDKNDPNIFKLYVYDNNFPGEERVMYLTRVKLISNVWQDSYAYIVHYLDGYEEYNQLYVNSKRILE